MCLTSGQPYNLIFGRTSDTHGSSHFIQGKELARPIYFGLFIGVVSGVCMMVFTSSMYATWHDLSWYHWGISCIKEVGSAEHDKTTT